MSRNGFIVLRFAWTCFLLVTLAPELRAQGSWIMKAPIPLARNEVALAALGGKIHVLGGSINNAAVTYHHEYDSGTDSWRERAPLPYALDHMGAAVLNDKIYTVGGFTASVHKDASSTCLNMTPEPTNGVC